MPNGGTIYAIGAEGSALVKIGSTRSSVRSRVEALRREKGWTKAELAKRSSLHYQHLYKVLAGERTHISVETIMGLARAFGVTPNDILGWWEDVDDDA